MDDLAAMPSVTFLLPDGRSVEVAVSAGTTVLQAARAADIPIEGACGGAMACATCHVHVEEAQFDRLDEPSDEEDDMLDLAQSLAPTSRLGCQIRLDDRIGRLIVRVPRTTLLAD